MPLGRSNSSTNNGKYRVEPVEGSAQSQAEDPIDRSASGGGGGGAREVDFGTGNILVDKPMSMGALASPALLPTADPRNLPATVATASPHPILQAKSSSHVMKNLFRTTGGSSRRLTRPSMSLTSRGRSFSSLSALGLRASSSRQVQAAAPDSSSPLPSSTLSVPNERHRPQIQSRRHLRFTHAPTTTNETTTAKYAFKRSLSFFAASTRSYDPNVLRRTLQEMQEGARYRYVLHPMSMPKLLWDFCTALFVLVYCWLVPVQMSFDFWPVSPTTHDFMLALDTWFIADMLLRFRTGTVECGVVILNPDDIWRHYVRSTWFYLDLCSSFPFELFFPDANDSTATMTTRHTVKLVKYLKIPKLLRLGRLLKNLKRYKGYTGIVTVMCSLFFLVHAACCIWVVLINPCDDHTILTEPMCDPTRFNDMYIMAFQLALAVLLGSADGPVQSAATVLGGTYKTGTAPPGLYVWCSIVQPLGAVYMALIFGNVITMVHSFNRIGNAFRKKMDQVYYEMESLNLPKPIRTRIQAYYDYLWINNRNLSETMTLLNDKGMSEPLRHQIAIYLYKDQLLKIPFFQHASDEVLGMICMMLRQVVFMPNDFIFKEGEIGRELYMIVKGCVEVLPPEPRRQRKLSNPPPVEKAILLADGDFFGEIGIVMEVFRTRSVRTKTMAELCILTRDGFNSILGDFPEFANEMKKLVVQRITLLYGSRNLSPETLNKITSIAEKNMQRRIKAYGEVVSHTRRKPSAVLVGRRHDKFDLHKRLDIDESDGDDETNPPKAPTPPTSESDESNADDDHEIDDKLVPAKVWKIARAVRKLKADAAARNTALAATLQSLTAAIDGLHQQVMRSQMTTQPPPLEPAPSPKVSSATP
ncbi:Aste57867_17458 [Aphanomyces stellatus]|uniref:Aste57867_17458 protein n=1 Tax=Aphanomyces stellatus TaxID=120398 RepID=A0A485L7V0_9STRA|nr:hypothetical protein As57867_017398 [Aphanomyces stellatus]VFT94212.1 Aste57867_17458 [Aphanomyces stellatus]